MAEPVAVAAKGAVVVAKGVAASADAAAFSVAEASAGDLDVRDVRDDLDAELGPTRHHCQDMEPALFRSPEASAHWQSNSLI